MIKKFHNNYHKGKLNLRNYLAAHRTVLANERTWLGYIRTSLTFFVAGVSFIEFFKIATLVIIGWVFVPLGMVCLVIGLWKYLKVRNMILSVERPEE